MERGRWNLLPSKLPPPPLPLPPPPSSKALASPDAAVELPTEVDERGRVESTTGPMRAVKLR